MVKLLNGQMVISVQSSKFNVWMVSGVRLKDLIVKLLYGYMVIWLQD